VKLSIYGLGYVGLTSAACALKSGLEVHGVDANASKVDTLARGDCPIHEPEIPELLLAGTLSGHFTVSARVGDELLDSDIAMVCVGTPSQSDGSHNMTFIVEVTRQIARHLAEHPRPPGRPLVLAYRSTMKPGSVEELVQPVLEANGLKPGGDIELVYHPEFLRESTAVKDYFSPPKIVYGTADGNACAALEALYDGIEAPRFATRYREAEMTKFVDNSFHALKVAFANEIGRIAYLNDVSASVVHEIFVADTKLNISPLYLRPGGAFGGSCLPKDVRALSQLAASAGAEARLIDNLLASNETHKRFLYEAAVDGLAEGATVLLVGLAFKADSDDMRESPLLDIGAKLVGAGFDVTILEENYNQTAIHAANYNHLMARLPQLDSIVVKDRAALGGRRFDLVIDGRGFAGELDITASRTFDATALP